MKGERVRKKEENVWEDFRLSLNDFSKMDYFESCFKRDIIDAGETMIYAKDNILQFERRYEYYEKNRDYFNLQQLENLRYELLELTEHIEARMEDVNYFMQKLKSLDWERKIKKDVQGDPEMTKYLMDFLKIIKRQYEIVHEMLKIRMEYIKESIAFLDLEIMIKTEREK